MVNPGTFTGKRKEFLDSQKELYATAVKDKHVADTVADIQRRYFKRFPLNLSHSEEPTQESLDSVDDDAPDPELLRPKAEGLSDEAYTRALRVYELQNTELKMRKEVCLFLSSSIFSVTYLYVILANKAQALISI